MHFPDFKSELECLKEGYTLVAGCDEAGRGPVAGPVVAAACILDENSIGKNRSKNKWYVRVRDSKMINEEEREILEKEILEHCRAYGVGIVSEKDIDKINIHNASLLAMRRAVEDLLGKIKNKSEKIFLFVDGRFKIPDLTSPSAPLSLSRRGERGEVKVEQRAVIDGDAKILSISAASIIAKVHRDNIMKCLDAKFPEYGFINHKGYGTPEHQKALSKWGPSSVHRRSFLKSI